MGSLFRGLIVVTFSRWSNWGCLSEGQGIPGHTDQSLQRFSAQGLASPHPTSFGLRMKTQISTLTLALALISLPGFPALLPQ